MLFSEELGKIRRREAREQARRHRLARCFTPGRWWQRVLDCADRRVPKAARD